MRLFGKEIEVQRYGCSEFGSKPNPMRPFVNLYVKVTNGCNARCAFCCNGECQPSNGFYLEKFLECLNEIHQSGIKLNRICLTGGEPSMSSETVKSIIECIDNLPYCTFTQLQLNTNALTEESLQLMAMQRFDVVSASLHHYDRDKLCQIFGIEIPSWYGVYPGVDRRKLNVSCNLIRGYIDSAVEVEKYLQFVASKGIRTVGFVGLMQLNEYCVKHFIDFSEIDWEAVPHLYKVREREHANHCKCRNYVYDSPDGMVNVYMRETVNPDYCGSSLLFDGVNLRQGFSSNNIIF